MAPTVRSESPESADVSLRAPKAPTAPLRIFLTTMTGLLLIQAVWILCVPPFAGTDEHDHALKAAAVAHGDVSRYHPSAGGYGELMWVPTRLVRASASVCADLDYSTVDNCVGTGRTRDGLSEVATSAARYNPVYYAVVGAAGRPFEGVTSLYAMRAATAVLCALLVAGAVVVTRGTARTRWPALGVLLVVTPIVLYSTMVVAPNGIEMAGALLTWTSLLAIVARLRRAEPVGHLVVVATSGALPLVAVRTLGPLWCLLGVLTVVWLLRREDRSALLSLRSVRACTALLVIVTAASLTWTLTAGTNAIEPGDFTGSLPRIVAREFVLWFFQSIGAFPHRNDPAPPLVYGVVLAAWAVVAALALRSASSRERAVLLLTFAVASLVPITVTVATYHVVGTNWQGRYSLPYSMGFLLICGWVLERRRPGVRLPLAVVVTVAAVLAVANGVSALRVRQLELGNSPLRDTAAWPTTPTVVLVALVIAGAALLTTGALGTGRSDVVARSD